MPVGGMFVCVFLCVGMLEMNNGKLLYFRSATDLPSPINK